MHENDYAKFAALKNKLLYIFNEKRENEMPKTESLTSMQTCYGMQYKKEYAYCQSYARISAVFPDMGQTEKERGESYEWALNFILPVYISC